MRGAFKKNNDERQMLEKDGCQVMAKAQMTLWVSQKKSTLLCLILRTDEQAFQGREIYPVLSECIACLVYSIQK